jgi:hypothetical protein
MKNCVGGKNDVIICIYFQFYKKFNNRQFYQLATQDRLLKPCLNNFNREGSNPATSAEKFWIISRIVCVQNRIIVDNIVFSKSYPRHLLMAFIFSNHHFMFKIVKFAHFLSIYSQSGRNSEKYYRFDILDYLSYLYSENGIYTISTEKAFIKTSKKRPFRQVPFFLGKIEKNSSYSLKFRQI